MSALPKQVQKQIAAANKVAEDYYKAINSPAGDPPAGDPPAGDPPPVAAAPAGDPPPAAPAPAPVAAAPAPAPAPIPQDSWEQKYKVLQGKYNAEVPRLQGQIREQSDQMRGFQEQLTATQNLLASLSQQRAAAPIDTSATPKPAAGTRLTKDEEVREFGPDLYDFIKRAAQEAVLPEVDSRMQRQVAPVAQRVEQATKLASTAAQRVAQNDQQTVIDMLDTQVPTWRDLNSDEGFLNWLDERDPYAGVERGKLLKQAYANHDGTRVVAFFRGYQNEHAVVSPTPAPAAAAAPAPAPQRSLESLVAPGTPKAAPTGTQDGSGKRVWTRAEISKFYADRSAGKYRTRPEEGKKVEADIFAAQREGRIR